MKHPKTDAARQEEALRIAQQLSETGLPYDHPGVAKLRAALTDFAERGASYSGVIKLPDLGFALDVKLSCQAHIASGVRVARAPGVTRRAT